MQFQPHFAFVHNMWMEFLADTFVSRMSNEDDQEDEDDQPMCFEAGHSRSGRRVTRHLV